MKTFRQDSSVIAYSQAGSSFQSFVIPERLEHFGNDEEGQLRRQAISMAINRDQIVKKVYNNTKTPATDFTSPLVPEYVKKLEKNGDNLKYNASKAKELWKKANAIKPWSGNFRIAYNADGGHMNGSMPCATASRTHSTSTPPASRTPRSATCVTR